SRAAGVRSRVFGRPRAGNAPSSAADGRRSPRLANRDSHSLGVRGPAERAARQCLDAGVHRPELRHTGAENISGARRKGLTREKEYSATKAPGRKEAISYYPGAFVA